MAGFPFVLRIGSVVCVFIGGLMSYGFILHKVGFILGVLAVIFFPVTIGLAPWYEGFAKGNWMPFLFVYGGLISTVVFGAIEDKLR